MGEFLTFFSMKLMKLMMKLKMMKLIVTLGLLVAIVNCGRVQRSGTISHKAGIDSYSAKQIDSATPLENGNKKLVLNLTLRGKAAKTIQKHVNVSQPAGL